MTRGYDREGLVSVATCFLVLVNGGDVAVSKLEMGILSFSVSALAVDCSAELVHMEVIGWICPKYSYHLYSRRRSRRR